MRISGFDNKPLSNTMSVKQYVAVSTLTVLTVLIFLFTLKMYISRQLPAGSEHRIYSAGNQRLIFESRNQELMEYIAQRNNISRLLNLKQQMVGQMECEVEFIYFLFSYRSVV